MRHALGLVVAGLIVVGWGCQSSSPSSSDDDTGGDESEAAQCEIDGECESYYRCIEGECSMPPAMTGERDEQTPRIHLYDDAELLASFYLELAVTIEEQTRGLMHRPKMLDDWGMLFVYDGEQELSFWMKNTLISLDMIFIDGGGEVVGVVHEAEPETETSRSVGEPARYVLEVNGGLAKEHGIDAGATMSLEYVEPSHQPDQ